MSEKTKCEVCGDLDMRGPWTDTHGVIQCWTCGTPYKILHYEGEGETRKRVEKPPEIYIKQEAIELCREYWQTFKRRMPSGCSFPGGQELASEDDDKAFFDWFNPRFEAQLAARKEPDHAK